MQVILLLTEFIAPPFSTVLMQALGSHFAFLMAVPLEALAFVVLGFIPNTRAPHNSPEGNAEGDEEEENQAAQEELRESRSGQPSWKQRALRGLSHLSHNIQHGVRTLGMQPGLLIGLVALVVAKMARPMLELILQYMSVRFGWPLGKACTSRSQKDTICFGILLMFLTNTQYLDSVLALDSSRRPDSALCGRSATGEPMASQENENIFCRESCADSSVDSVLSGWSTLHGPGHYCSRLYYRYVPSGRAQLHTGKLTDKQPSLGMPLGMDFPPPCDLS